MEAATGPIGVTRGHEFIVRGGTGECAVFCDRDFLDYDVLGSDIDYSDRSSVEKVVDYFTSLYARTDEKHDQAAFEQGVPAERRSPRSEERRVGKEWVRTCRARC